MSSHDNCKGKRIEVVDFGNRDYYFSKDCWEFCVEPIPHSDQVINICDRYEFKRTFGLKFPNYISDSGISIKHLGTGVKFHFSAHDAISLWVGEKFDDSRFGKKFRLPTYPSPLESTVYDSPYIGRIVIENPGVEKYDFSPVWDDVDWETLSQQVVWTDENSLLSAIPTRPFFRPPVESKSDIRSLIGEGLNDTLINNWGRMFSRFPFIGHSDGDVHLWHHLVVTNSGWFFSLRNVILNRYEGIERVREIKMHCNFDDDIIYREIIERQSKGFEERLFARRDCQMDIKMLVYYHEVKKHDIRGRNGQENRARMVRNVSFTPAEMNGKYIGELELPDDKIGIILANFGSQIELIEVMTRTRIQIIPLFHFPHCPAKSADAPRIAHIYGSESNVECAKSWLVQLLSRGGVAMKHDTSSTCESSSQVFPC